MIRTMCVCPCPHALGSCSLVDAAVFVVSGVSRVPEVWRSGGVVALDVVGAAWTMNG